MDLNVVSGNIDFVLMQTARAYRKALEEEFAPSGLTFRQAEVLGFLWRAEHVSPCELAQLLMIEPATIAGILERMQNDGLIRCVPDASDRRRKVIRLTGRSKELCKEVFECANRVSNRAAQGISAEEQDTLCVLLKQVMHNLGERQEE